MANNLLQMANGKAHDSINGLMVDGYRGTLPLTMEMFPEKRWSDDQGRQWTSNIKTRLEKDNGKWYLFPTMMGGLDLPEEGAYRGALRGKHFGVYDSYDEGMKADKVIHDYFDRIKGYQSGGTVEPLRKSPKRLRTKVRDFLTNVTEKNRLLDMLYHSPEESFDKALGNVYAFGVSPTSEAQKSDQRMLENVRGEGLKELWKEAGSPRVKLHDERYGSYEPSDASWLFGKKDPLSFLKKQFGADTMYIPRSEFGDGDRSTAIAELAHGIRFADPEQFSNYKTREDLILSKAGEFGEQHLYHTPGTDEYDTHQIVEPQLRNWLIKNYGL